MNGISALMPVAGLIAFAVVSMAAVSCSTTRLLGDGQYRLASNKVKIEGNCDFKEKEVEAYIKQKSNSYMAFGWNPFLYVYNWSGKDESRRFNRFIRKVGVAPVVYQPSQVDASIDNIKRHLEYIGYYGSDVESEVEVNGRKVDVTYTVIPGKRYKVGKLTYSVPGGSFEKDFLADTANVSIKPGDYLSEDALEKESVRSSAWFRRNGYFGFTKNYYTFEADTLGGGETAPLRMIIREYTRNQSPEDARPFVKYNIGDVTISYDKDLKFNERLLQGINTILPGKPYDEVDVNNTYSRLSALKLFSGVNIAMNESDSGVVDCDINLSKSRLQGFKINLEGSTNSSGLIGVSPQLSYFHKNIFHGGEWLNLSFLGNFQFKYDNSAVKSNEFGVSSSISFPEFLGLPNSLFKGPSVPRTELKSSYNYQDRPEYTRNIFSVSFGYSGSMNRQFFYQIDPVQAKIVRLYHLDPGFYNTLAGNPFMRDAYQNHFDVGTGAMVHYTSSPDLIPRETFEYFRVQFDASGNVISMLNSHMKTDEYGNRLIWGTPYSQYIRGEVTLGKTFVFGSNGRRALAMRVLGGFGHAYGNSSSLPFEKQFYSGGANSMRGWQARALGPGMSKQDPTFVIPSQTGDMKLEANLEYRFPLFWKFCGALFGDAGNIWTLKENDGMDNDRSHFTLRNLPESLAANWGFGLRADLTFLVLRIDLGMKIYDPSLDKDRWYGPSRWFRNDSFALHFGVGYPF